MPDYVGGCRNEIVRVVIVSQYLFALVTDHTRRTKNVTVEGGTH